MIEMQRQRTADYRRNIAQRQAIESQRARDLERQRRIQQYRYQQWYYQQVREQQSRWTARRYSYYDDPYYYTPASYRYIRGSRYYDVNRYAADLLQQAVRYGYQQGYRAGRADRLDGWAESYRDSFAYQDANYGYNGYYVNQGEYNYYFRQGFRRGYDDGYGSRYRYGTYANGDYSILSSVLSVILNLQSI